jgi:hypothetical protein
MANPLVFAQPPSTPPDANSPNANHTTTINLWFFATDPGGGPVLPHVNPKHGADEAISIQWHNDSLLRVCPFGRPRAGQFVVMQLVGHGASVGGSELRLITVPQSLK